MSKEVITVDLGGTYMRFAYFKNGEISKYIKKNTPKKKKDILKEIVNGIKDYMNKNVRGIGISYAGVIRKVVVERSPNLPLSGFNLKKYLQVKFKKIVEVENDANCFALAERKFGVKKKNLFVLTLGTGVGGGIIIDGELYKGKGSAGEFGEMILNQGKNLEYFAGTNAIKRLIKKYYKVKSVDKDLIKEILHNSTSKSFKIRDEVADYIGQGNASLISVLDPEIIVLGGGMRSLGEPFLNLIKQKTKKHGFLIKIPEIKWSKLKYPELIGAGLLFK